MQADCSGELQLLQLAGAVQGSGGTAAALGCIAALLPCPAALLCCCPASLPCCPVLLHCCAAALHCCPPALLPCPVVLQAGKGRICTSVPLNFATVPCSNLIEGFPFLKHVWLLVLSPSSSSLCVC